MITDDEVRGLFQARVPADWFAGPITVEMDDDEILCLGLLAGSETVDDFRERTRAERMAIAADAEAHFGRKVSWGVERDGATVLFTNLSTPVMTRLRLHERVVLDTLISSGVARSRSDALAWCVKLVARNEGQWLDELREALVGVENVRAGGPTLI